MAEARQPAKRLPSCHAATDEESEGEADAEPLVDGGDDEEGPGADVPSAKVATPPTGDKERPHGASIKASEPIAVQMDVLFR